MKIGIRKYILLTAVSFVLLFWGSGKAAAADITAVDFNGNVVGQVISTGMVINADGENIGYITADSLILNSDGEIIGGVVPQGIAIGLDNHLLGKINSDGIVRNLTGKPQGKALPNGLVVNGAYEVIGSILFPGLVYSSDGNTIGRVTGAGTYAALDGTEIGHISANGFAYRNSGNEYILDGRLISAKMVVSTDGRFIGSIAPSGKVIDFEGSEIGVVHANEYVYSKENKIIGRVVRPSYAFDIAGNYLGIVSYNGAVVKGESEVARYRSDGNIVNKKNEVIGFSVPMSATANDLSGNYLGRVVPEGKVLKGLETVGRVGARGFVYNDKNEKIGELTHTGPVFDALGNLSGQSMPNGTYISLKGSYAGRIKGGMAYDGNGVLAGGVSDNMLAFNTGNRALGIANVDSSVNVSAEKQKISPFGYLLTSENRVVGLSWRMQPVYGLEGITYSYITPDGNLYREITDAVLGANGTLFDAKGYIGSRIDSLYALGLKGQDLGISAENNAILNGRSEVVFKITPGGYVVDSAGTQTQNVMPVRGYSGENRIAVNMSGDLLGYADSEGNVTDLNGSRYGNVLYGGYVSDNNHSVTGKLIPFTVPVNDKCAAIGVINGRGEVINNRGVPSGHILPNGQAVSDVGAYIGYAPSGTGLIDFDGNFSGIVNLGQGVNAENKTLGCVNRHGIIINSDNKWQYGVITPNPVIDFDNKVIAQILANGTAVSAENQVLGYMQPNGNVVSKSKKVLGNVMRYKVAFNNDNTFLGMVQPSGQVTDKDGKTVGQVYFDGSVQNNGDIIGYALYDWYVYDENFVVYGYLTKDGTVLNLSGSRLGRVDKGFVVGKNREVVARGNRDYTVRDVSNNAVGEILMNGTVTDYNNQNVGYLADAGVIRNSGGDEIARAYPLQYYIVTDDYYEGKKQRDRERDVNRVQIQDEKKENGSAPVTDEQSQSGTVKKNYSNKILGIALDPYGNVIGNVYGDGTVRDENDEFKGYLTGDNTIVDEQGNVTGFMDTKTGKGVWIPAGATGRGQSYGIGNRTDATGPGGGMGPGEKYDPAHLQALNALQAARRSTINVGVVHNNVKVSDFTGYEEDDWPGSTRSVSTWRVDMSEMILEDKPIPAVLARSVYASEGFGSNIPVTAIVERNVYAEEGRNIIIPAGSRVIGSLGGEGGDGSSGGNSGGAVKIGISWKRLIRPDGSQFNFGGASQTADAQGRAGAIGYLDEQLLKKYSRPLLMSMVESAAAYATAAGDGSSESSSGTTTTDAKTEAANDARQNFIDQMNEIFQEIIESKSNIQAVTYIPVGTRIIIFPNQDLWLNSEKRSKVAGTSNAMRGDGLTVDNPEDFGGRTGGGTTGTARVRSEFDENVQPQGGGLTEESPEMNDTRRRRPVRVPQNTGQTLPPSTTQQTSTTGSSADEYDPQLL